MAGANFIRHRNTQILYIDFSYAASQQEVLQIITDAQALITTQPFSSVLTLTNITDAYFDVEVSQALKQLAAHNKPYVKAGAVVGVTKIRRIIYEAVMFFAKRHLEIFDGVETAKEWLIQQGGQ